MLCLREDFQALQELRSELRSGLRMQLQDFGFEFFKVHLSPSFVLYCSIGL